RAGYHARSRARGKAGAGSGRDQDEEADRQEGGGRQEAGRVFGQDEEARDLHQKGAHQEEVTEAAVRVERLQKTLGKKEVLHGMSFVAGKGEIFGLLGPNGAGKTTTLRLLCTLLAPDAGSINVLGFDTRTAPSEVRRRVGVVTAEIGV